MCVGGRAGLNKDEKMCWETIFSFRVRNTGISGKGKASTKAEVNASIN